MIIDMVMRENVIKTKSFAFALKVVKTYKILLNKREFILSKQMLRSGTAVDAMVRVA